jgi:hypothetical protein
MVDSFVAPRKAHCPVTIHTGQTRTRKYPTAHLELLASFPLTSLARDAVVAVLDSLQARRTGRSAPQAHRRRMRFFGGSTHMSADFDTKLPARVRRGRWAWMESRPPTSSPQPILPISVTIGGRAAAVTDAGGAPGLFAGFLQVKVQVPTGVPPGPRFRSCSKSEAFPAKWVLRWRWRELDGG